MLIRVSIVYSFVLLNRNSLFGIYHNLFIHSLADRYLWLCPQHLIPPQVEKKKLPPPPPLQARKWLFPWESSPGLQKKLNQALSAPQSEFGTRAVSQPPSATNWLLAVTVGKLNCLSGLLCPHQKNEGVGLEDLWDNILPMISSLGYLHRKKRKKKTLLCHSPQGWSWWFLGLISWLRSLQCQRFSFLTKGRGEDGRAAQRHSW